MPTGIPNTSSRSYAPPPRVLAYGTPNQPAHNLTKKRDFSSAANRDGRSTELPWELIEAHFEGRVQMTAGILQAAGVLARAGAIGKDQEIIVGRGISEPDSPVGSGNKQAAHMIAGGVYVRHSPGDRLFDTLVKEGYRPDDRGVIEAPLWRSARSDQGKLLINPQQVPTTILSTLVNRVELSAEGTRGNQPPQTAGEKTALQKSLREMQRFSEKEKSSEEISSLAIELTVGIGVAVEQKLLRRDKVLAKMEQSLPDNERKPIQQLRQIIETKFEYSSPTKVKQILKRGHLAREAEVLFGYEDTKVKTQEMPADRDSDKKSQDKT